MPSVITSRAIARPASKLLLASPLQTMSRSVTIPISRSSSPIGMQPMSCSRINFASSVTGVLGLTQSTPLCITSLTFMADLPLLEFQVHLMQCSTALISQLYNRSGATAPAPQGRRRKDHSYAIGPDKRRRGRRHPPEHLTATSRPGFPPNIAKSMGRAFDAKAGLSISGFTKALCQAGASAMTSVCGNRVARAQGGIAKRILRAMYLLAGGADEVVAPEQLLAVERLVGTQPEYIRHEVAPCNHLGLFMGKRTLEAYWPKIVRWMREVD